MIPRHIAMYLCREMTQTNFKEIGNIMGKRDHSTVIHGYDKISYEIRNSENMKNMIDVLIKKINP